MNVVIQCASSKRSYAGHLRRRDGTPVAFVADPAHAPGAGDQFYARPDDLADDGRTWRDLLLDYNRSPGRNPLNLLPASELYAKPAYGRLIAKFGIDKLFILSAGWGLIPATFLTPAYDITFSQGAENYKRRRKSDAYRDLCLFPADSDEPLVFLGGKDYLPLFAMLTGGAKGRRIVFYNSMHPPPEASGCTPQRYWTKTQTNWHYECAEALIDGRVASPG
jgi:hypothetical protein